MSSPLPGPDPSLVPSPALHCLALAPSLLSVGLAPPHWPMTPAPSLTLEVSRESLSLSRGLGQVNPNSGSPQNAQQVHFRTHLEEKPHVCPFCSRGFREKGSLVRHVRHHTGEKPFKCYKCGRGFAEHGTLNRHLRTKGWGLAGGGEGRQESSPGQSCPALTEFPISGGCLLEVEELLVSEESPTSAATVLGEDPHTVLVEFSSVVADTQEYIIEVGIGLGWAGLGWAGAPGQQG